MTLKYQIEAIHFGMDGVLAGSQGLASIFFPGGSLGIVLTIYIIHCKFCSSSLSHSSHSLFLKLFWVTILELQAFQYMGVYLADTELFPGCTLNRKIIGFSQLQ